MLYLLLVITLTSLIFNFLLYRIAVRLVIRNLELGDEFTLKFIRGKLENEEVTKMD